MSTVSDFDRDTLAFASEVDSEDTQATREVLHKFIQANYQKYTLYQLSLMLNVSPAFIQSQLTSLQVTRCGRRATPTVLILRDIDKFEEDKLKWQS